MRKNIDSFVPRWAQKLVLVALATGAFLVAYTLLDSPTQAAPAPKVEICHIPPDNPTNFHTIKVSDSAQSAPTATNLGPATACALCFVMTATNAQWTTRATAKAKVAPQNRGTQPTATTPMLAPRTPAIRQLDA